jgi:hypothetical protein
MKYAVSLLLGALVGALIALLLAPSWRGTPLEYQVSGGNPGSQGQGGTAERQAGIAGAAKQIER